MSQTCDSHIFATHGSPSIEKNTWRKASTRENQRSIENNRVGDISASGMKERNTADSGFLLSVTQNNGGENTNRQDRKINKNH